MKLELLKSFWKIASRSLWRNKLFSFISIAGFTVGLTVFILLMTFVHNEMSFDSFHKNKDRIFRAVLYTPYNNTYYGNFPLSLSQRMREAMPRIEGALNCLDKNTEIKVNGDLLKEKVTFAGPGFFKMFSFRTLAGNPYAFGNDPLSIFVTESFAKRNFGQNYPVGKTISINIEGEFCNFLIGGIVKDPPGNTCLKFSVLVPFINAEKMWIMKFSKEDIHPGEFLPSLFLMLKNETDKVAVDA
ncbi:MAG: ABC transporter permease, partial [Bacillota bacterium]